MVPSSGSITQRRPLVPALGAALLADQPVVGAGGEQRRHDEPLGRPVHLRHHVGGGRLGLDGGARLPEPVEQQVRGPLGGIGGEVEERPGPLPTAMAGDGTVPPMAPFRPLLPTSWTCAATP